MSDALGSLPQPRPPRSLATGALRWLRLRPPGEPVREWHVSPVVDAIAYHWSWLWVLVPLLVCGPAFPGDYAAIFMGVLTVSFVHRHYTLAYVYTDRRVFDRHRRPFVTLPLLAGAGLVATPWLLRADLPAFDVVFHGKALVTTVVFVAGLWNVWHVLAQKYGILRIYESKARGDDLALGVPARVDRWFVYGWLPLVALVLAASLSDFILHEYRIARWFVEPALRALLASQTVALPLAALLALAVTGRFVAYEWRVHRFRNRARLSMALGTASLWGSLLVFDPIKVYVAFAFSHAIEYLVFVWAVQRRSWASDDEKSRPAIASHPWAAYGGFSLALAAFYFAFTDWQDLAFWSGPGVALAGLPIGHWIFYWGVWQSLLHFAYDGLLWHTRDPAVRELI
jgi:hypothetical protein